MKTPSIQALYSAVQERDLDAVRRLIAAGVSVNERHPWEGDCRVLHRAVCDPVDVLLVQTLLEAGADPEDRHLETGGTPLHQLLHASLPLEHMLEVVDLLLGHGADVNAIGKDCEETEFTAVDILTARGPGGAPLLEALIARGALPGPDSGL